MQDIIEKLKSYENQNPVRNYDWPIMNPPIPVEGNSSFEKNIFLKENFHRFLSNADNLDDYYWIIKSWGRISSFKRCERNDSLINDFISKIKIRRNLNKQHFGVISSLSKIASFVNPNEYAIYDSRVIFALNWLMVRNIKNPILFPQPQGRGESTKYDMNTLLEFSNLAYTYKDTKIAYYEYSELMKKFSEEIYKSSSTPYLPEMLLFRLAEDTAKDMKSSISINIKTSF